MNTNLSFDAIIVGAGCAGLSAATSLSQMGKRVCLIEKSRILGGRTSSIVDPQSGEVIDNGQHLFLGCYQATQDFLTRIQSIEQLTFFDGFETMIAGFDQQKAYLKTYSLPAPFHLLWGYLHYSAFSLPERLSIVQVVFNLKMYSEEKLSSMSCEEFLTQSGQSKNTKKKFWDLIILATLNLSPHKAPANLLKVVLEKGFMASKKASRAGVSQVGLTELFGNPSKKYLEEKNSVVMRANNVKSLLIERSRVVGVMLQDGQKVYAKNVVSCVPPPALAKLLSTVDGSQNLIEKLQSFQTSSIVSLNFWTNEVILDDPFVGFWDTDFHWLFSKRTFFKDKHTKHYTLVASNADHLIHTPLNELLDMAKKTIACIYPKPFEILRAKKSVMKNATFCPPLGDTSARFSAKSDISGLWYAGDWTDTKLPSTIESAVVSGHMVAKLIDNGL